VAKKRTEVLLPLAASTAPGARAMKDAQFRPFTGNSFNCCEEVTDLMEDSLYVRVSLVSWTSTLDAAGASSIATSSVRVSPTVRTKGLVWTLRKAAAPTSR
jgi:hypothetical protein